jgi:hypothetical protein
MRDQWDELYPLLRMTQSGIVRLVDREDAVHALAGAVEKAASDATRSRSSALQTAARSAATALAKAAILRDGDTVQLPVKGLRDAVELWRGSGDIAFGDKGVVDVALLRALVRRCTGLDSTIITLTDHQLAIAYSTTRSRGVIRLVLGPRKGRDDVLVVPISARAAPLATRGVIYAPAPWPMDDPQGASSPQPPLPPQRPVLALVR